MTYLLLTVLDLKSGADTEQYRLVASDIVCEWWTWSLGCAGFLGVLQINLLESAPILALLAIRKYQLSVRNVIVP